MTIKKFIGDKAFYKMAMTVAVPIMIQNFITNFVSMLDNLMVSIFERVRSTKAQVKRRDKLVLATMPWEWFAEDKPKHARVIGGVMSKH